LKAFYLLAWESYLQSGKVREEVLKGYYERFDMVKHEFKGVRESE